MKYCFMIAITYRDSAAEGTRRGWVLRLGTGLKFLCDSAEPVIDAIDAFSVDRYGCMERRGGSPARFSPAALHPQPGTGLRACPVYGEEHRHDGVFYGGGGGLPGGEEAAVFQAGGRRVRLEFVGTTGRQRIESSRPVGGKAHFLIGSEENWRLGLPLYDGIAYRELYPGIDMVYAGNGRNLKSEFLVAPGADPAQIRVRYGGADGLRVEEDGSLTIRLGRRVLREDAPVIYQQRDG